MCDEIGAFLLKRWSHYTYTIPHGAERLKGMNKNQHYDDKVMTEKNTRLCLVMIMRWWCLAMVHEDCVQFRVHWWISQMTESR